MGRILGGHSLDMRIILNSLKTVMITVYRVRLVKFCEGGNKHEESIKRMKLIESLSECQLLKEGY
jgi:hypothetical protein